MGDMDPALKQRLVGAVVLIALAVIFLPALFNGGRPSEQRSVQVIPPMPNIQPIEIRKAQRPSGIPADDKLASKMYEFDEEKALVDKIAVEKTSDEKSTSSKPESALDLGLKTNGAPKAWVIQVGSFSDKSKADKLKKDLQSDGYKAFTRSVNKKGKTINRVMIGPKLDKKQALRIQQAVNKQYALKTLLMSFEP